MRKPNTPRKENNPTGNPPPPVNSGDERTNQYIHQSETAHNSPKQPKSNPNVFKRALAFLGNKDSQPFITNIIYVCIFLITAVLAWYTYQLFKQASTQSLAAQKSATASEIAANATKKSADLQKQALDSQIADKKVSDITNADRIKREIALFKLQKTNDSTQIASLKETQKEFEINNAPYLEISDIEVLNFKKDAKPTFKFYIFNLKETPAKIISIKSRSGVDFGDIKYDTIKLIPNRDQINQYIIKDAPVEEDYTILDDYTNNDWRQISSGKNYCFIAIEIKFKNLANNKIRFYRVLVKVKPLSGNRAYTQFIYNENSDK
jgi:acetolactate synthase small subunit